MNEDYSYFQDEEFRQSLAAYEHMLQSGEPTDLDPETLTDIAEYYAMEQRESEAEKCIQYALSFFPDSIDPQIFLARQQMFRGNLEQAWKICESIADQDEQEVVFLRAELLFHAEQDDDAFELLFQTYQSIDDDLEAADFVYDCVGLCKDYGLYDKGMEWTELLRKDFPDYTEAIPLQAELHNLRGEHSQAIELLEAHISLMPYDIKLWIQMADAYLWLEQYEEACEAIDYALAIAPDDAEAILMCAHILHDSENYAEAHAYYARFLEYYPQDPRACYLDAQCLIETGDYREAIRLLETTVPLSKNLRGYALSYLAYCHHMLRHDGQAQHYRQLAEQEKENNLSMLFPDLYPGGNPSQAFDPFSDYPFGPDPAPPF